jgi:hypothetical protein
LRSGIRRGGERDCHASSRFQKIATIPPSRFIGFDHGSPY